MSSTTTIQRNRPAWIGRGRTRPLAVAGAILVAAAVWVLAVPLLGTQLLVRFGDSPPQSVGIGFVLGGGLVASLVGWSLLAILEKRTVRARDIWTGIAIAVLLVSLTLPLAAGTTMSTKAALALMHLGAASVLIPTLRRG